MLNSVLNRTRNSLDIGSPVADILLALSIKKWKMNFENGAGSIEIDISRRKVERQ